MPPVERSSDVKEVYGSKALASIISGVVLLAIGLWFVVYPSDWTAGLKWVLLVAGIALIIYGLINVSKIRQVSGVGITCPYCNAKNTFTHAPSDDVRCNDCLRMIPITEGRILRVNQVRCGFCNALNFYSERSVGLICEECNREIPISTADGSIGKTALSAYTQHDDNKSYDLILSRVDHRSEELIGTLQHMLALNRNHIKDMLDQTPIMLLTGITRRKADMLKAQLELHEASVDIKETQ